MRGRSFRINAAREGIHTRREKRRREASEFSRDVNRGYGFGTSKAFYKKYLGLEVDFDNYIKTLDGLELVHPPLEHAWGQRAVRFYDPDGHIIEVGENIGAAVQRFRGRGMTISEIAVQMDVDEKYVREWLECTARDYIIQLPVEEGALCLVIRTN